MGEAYRETTRDRIVVGLANWLIRTFATKKYNRIAGAIVNLGYREADRITREEDID